MRSISVVLLVLAYSSVALAQADFGVEPDADAEAQVGETSPEPAAAPSASGLRNGFSLSAGQEFGGDRDISGTMFGVDWRIGWRINEPIALYLHSHLSFGSASEGNVALDYRAYFADQGYGTVNQIQVSLGYDRF
jgi:hypothetical protein